ncbi:MAG: 2,3,4,5-tetrahydropyridine-2,6-dicarboxylate N-succinyltransferase [Ornithinimicrobium sp.]
MSSTAQPSTAVSSGATDLAAFFGQPLAEITAASAAPARVHEALDALQDGAIRAATRDDAGQWHTHTWVKQVILAAFALSVLTPDPAWPGGAIDKSLVPARAMTLDDGVRVVPGGSSIRRGAHLHPGVVLMPPSYVNIGASVGAGSMIDSHVLVGSCAQVGAGVHLSAAVQLGGVLEPIGARPVVVEDGAFIGAQCGLYEGVVVREGAVLAPAVTLTASTTIFDLVHGRTVRGEVPAGAVVVPGSRPARGSYAQEHGLALYAPIIVKYRDADTAAAVVLEEALR